MDNECAKKEDEQMEIIEAFAVKNKCYQEGVPRPNAAAWEAESW